ncbi:MAG: hypothetical protein ABL871_09845 [Terricaulis sp.]
MRVAATLVCMLAWGAADAFAQDSAPPPSPPPVAAPPPPPPMPRAEPVQAISREMSRETPADYGYSPPQDGDSGYSLPQDDEDDPPVPNEDGDDHDDPSHPH